VFFKAQIFLFRIIKQNMVCFLKRHPEPTIHKPSPEEIRQMIEEKEAAEAAKNMIAAPRTNSLKSNSGTGSASNSKFRSRIFGKSPLKSAVKVTLFSNYFFTF
jgi:hypothetical protein